MKIKRPRRPKTIALMLLGGFLAFAPPGTLIACAALLLALFGYCTGSGGKQAPAPQATQQQQQQPPPQPTPNVTPAPER